MSLAYGDNLDLLLQHGCTAVGDGNRIEDEIEKEYRSVASISISLSNLYHIVKHYTIDVSPNS